MSTPQIVGLSGLKASGKSTVANYLVDEHQFLKLSFGDMLKNVTANTFSLRRDLLEGETDQSRAWREEHIDASSGLTPRQLLQQVGSQMRAIDPDVWINVVKGQALRAIAAGYSVVVTDVRFPNELDLLCDIGEVWRIEPAAEKFPLWYTKLTGAFDTLDYSCALTSGLLTKYTNEHESETLLSLATAQDRMASIINNDGTLEDLYNQIEDNLYYVKVNNQEVKQRAVPKVSRAT